MSIIAKNKGGDFKQLPPATYSARCYQIVDLGHQKNEHEGKITVKHQVLVSWEIPTELLDDGEPMSIGKFYTLSLHPKSNLGQDLVSWRGKAFTTEEEAGFDVSNLAGVPCMLSVIDKNGKSRVSSVSGLPKGMTVPDQINDSLVFSMEDYSKGDTSIFDKLSEGIQAIVLKSEDLKKQEQPVQSENPAEGLDGLDPDIPF
jgi:hypothetical protein